MKRPEGFDAPDAGADPAPVPTDRRRRPLPRPFPSRGGAAQASTEEIPVVTPPLRGARDASEPVTREQEQPPAPPARPPRVARERSAAAQLRAAERARKRQESRELKRFTKRTRRRRAAWFTGFGVAGALVLLVVAAVFSPLLALRHITIDGTQRLDAAQLVDAVDDQMGTPLALLNEGRIREQLGSFTLIRSFTTELAPPGTLIIHIVEREPVGTVARAGGFDLVDAAGVVIATTPERTPGSALIQVADDDVSSSAFQSAAEVLLALPADLRAQVDSIQASSRDNVVLVLAGSDQRVAWGSAERAEHKARVLAALIALHGGDGAGLYDVSAPGSAVFRRG